MSPFRLKSDECFDPPSTLEESTTEVSWSSCFGVPPLNECSRGIVRHVFRPPTHPVAHKFLHESYGVYDLKFFFFFGGGGGGRQGCVLHPTVLERYALAKKESKVLSNSG